MPSPEKFLETLKEYNVDKEIIDAIYDGYDNIVTKTKKEIRSAFFKQTLEVMNARLYIDTVQAILEANACCKCGARDKCSKQFSKINANPSIKERLELISSRPYINMGYASLQDDDTIFLMVFPIILMIVLNVPVQLLAK